MNFFDIIVIAVVLFCLIRGFFRGFIREASSIIGVLAAFYGAVTYYPVLAVKVGFWISTPLYASVASFVLLFVGILIAVNAVAYLIRYLMQVAFLGWFDRLLGIVFGAAKGVIVVSILFIVVTAFVPNRAGFLSKSVFAPHVSVAAEFLTVFVAEEMKKEVKTRVKGV
ncbi:MAG: CvpA family protein [Desulfobacteraceae bacterium]